MHIDIEKMRALEKSGLVSRCKHQELPISVYKYTHKCMYERLWDDLTLISRGMVLSDENGKVINRGFKKCFSISEHDGVLLPELNWNQKYEVTEKMDGVCAFLVQYEGRKFISTLGSFYSYQAKIANDIFSQKGYDTHLYDEELTYIWELIHPKARIVINYGSIRDLVLLDVINTKTGASVGRDFCEKESKKIGCPIVRKYDVSVDEYLDSVVDDGEKEGVVLKFSDGNMAKLKLSEYVRIHGIITGVTEKKIWESMKDGKNILDALVDVPDELYNFVSDIYNEIQERYEDYEEKSRRIVQRLEGEISHIKNESDRKKSFVIAAKNENDDLLPIVISMYSKKDYSEVIWKKLKPKKPRVFPH